MIPVHFQSVFGRKTVSSRRNTSRLRRAWRFDPLPEALEVRLTPTANIAITGASVVNSSGSGLSNISAGETIDIKASWTTSNLPSGASYTIAFQVNGLILTTGTITSGAGNSGTQSWSYNSSASSDDFTAAPGSNQVFATVDPAHTVVESSYTDNTTTFNFTATGNGGQGLITSAEMRQAYGISAIPSLGTTAADGTGQTVAIVDAYNDPTCVTDLDAFDQDMALSTSSPESLYQAYGPDSGFFSVYNQNGVNITADVANSGSDGVPQANAGWDGEITLDIEWVHSIAPGAKIDLVEANSASGDLYTAETAAAKLPGVTEVSNSWGGGESSGETSSDSVFTTPSGHVGVTFVVATGDSGAPGGYPAYSPNVVAVGGTQLSLASDGYGSETDWSFPTPYQTLNNGSGSYSQSGSWSSASGGFSGNYSVAAGGSSSTATWTVSGVSGTTEVSTTWTANSANATNATYSIYDGSSSSGTLLGTVSVDQTKTPVGTPDGKFDFVDLGNYDPSSGSLTIVLNASTANGKVVADAIGLADASADGGGQSLYEKEPTYQDSVQSSGFRTIPDVSFDASVYSAVFTLEDGSLGGVAGTSLACPCWAGLISIINQDRVYEGGSVLNSNGNQQQTQLGLYSIPSSDYNDITTGYNGFAAGPGYDLATGLGTPIATLLVPAMAAFQNLDELTVTSEPPANVVAGSPFGLKVTVESSLGQPITTYNGPVTIALGNDPGNDVLGGTLTVNAVNGVATFSGLTLTTADSGYTIVATATKLTSGKTTAFSVIAAAPSQLLISSEPASSVTAGSAFGLGVTVEDAYGNIVTADTGTVTVAIGNDPGNASLGGTLTVSTVDGVATFSNLTLTTADAGYTILISRPGLTGVTSSPITITPAAPAKTVVFQAPPTSVVAGVTFGLVVAIEDTYGNIETGDDTASAVVTPQLTTGPLLGTTSETAVDGIITFSNLVEDQAGTIALTFTSPSLNSQASGNITVLPAAPTQLVIQDEPSSEGISGLPFTVQPLIYEEDAFGNLESGDNSTLISATMVSGAGVLEGTTTAVVTAGAARFLNLTDDAATTLTLKFSGGSLPSVISSNVVLKKVIPTISLASGAAAGNYKLASTFTASVAPSPSGVLPTGTVKFLDGSTVLGSAPLNSSGVATFSTTALPLGTQSITAVYSGDNSNASVTSSAISYFVGDNVTDDFDGDGKSDIAVFGYNSNYGKYGYTIENSSSGFTTTTFFDNNGYGFGNAQSIPVPGDYFGDGQDAYALWTPNTVGGMTFTAISSVTGKSVSVNFGGTNMIPVVADIEGNGKDDFGVYGYLPGYGYGFDFLLSSDNFNVNDQYIFNNNGYGYGNASSIPVVADFDGSGHAGFGLYTPSSTGSTFTFVDPSTNTSFTRTISPSLGTAKDIPLAVNYDGSNKDSLALYGPSPANANQYRYLVLTASSGFNPSQAVTFNNNGYGYGNSTSIPIIADYQGNGEDDFAVYTPGPAGSAQYYFQTDQTGAGDAVDTSFGTSPEVTISGSTYLMTKKVRGY